MESRPSIPTRPGLALAAALLAASLSPGCGRPVEARARSEVEEFVRALARAASEMDLEAYSRGFAADCPITVRFAGKTKRTTWRLYRETLEEALERTERNEVTIESIEVEPRGREYRVRTAAREVTEVDGRTVEGTSRTVFDIARTPEGLRVVSYETSLAITRVVDPREGEVDPARVRWDDPEAR